MKLPTELMIMGKIVKVKYEREPKDEDGEPALGLCDASRNIIFVCTKHNETEAEALSTLAHEMTHYVIAKSGLSELITDKEESLVIVLEEHLLPLFSFKRKRWRKCQEVTLGS